MDKHVILQFSRLGCIPLINTTPPASSHRTGNTGHRATCTDQEKNSRCSSRLQSWPDSAAASSCGKKQASEKLIILFFIVMNSPGAKLQTLCKLQIKRPRQHAGAYRSDRLCPSPASKRINACRSQLLASDCALIDGGFWEEDLDTSPHSLQLIAVIALGARAGDVASVRRTRSNTPLRAS